MATQITHVDLDFVLFLLHKIGLTHSRFCTMDVDASFAVFVDAGSRGNTRLPGTSRASDGHSHDGYSSKKRQWSESATDTRTSPGSRLDLESRREIGRFSPDRTLRGLSTSPKVRGYYPSRTLFTRTLYWLSLSLSLVAHHISAFADTPDTSGDVPETKSQRS